MLTDALGVPIFSSARAVLVERRPDLAQLIRQSETAFAITVKPSAHQLIGPAMNELINIVRTGHPNRSQAMAIKLICAVNPWAKAQSYKRWRRRAGLSR